MQGLFLPHCRLSLHNGFRMVPVPAPSQLLLTSSLGGAPPPQSRGLAYAISVLSGILLRTDSCFQSDSDVKLFPWPLTQLLWAGSLPHQSLLFSSQAPPVLPKVLSSQSLSSTAETWRRKSGAREGVSPLRGPGPWGWQETLITMANPVPVQRSHLQGPILR